MSAIITGATLRACIERAGELEVETMASFTPWELVVKALAHKRSRHPRAEKCFDLQESIASNVERGYRLYHLRKAINRLWFLTTRRANTTGQMMYAAARRK